MEKIDLNKMNIKVFREYVEKCCEIMADLDTDGEFDEDDEVDLDEYYYITREERIPDSIAKLVWITPLDTFKQLFKGLDKSLNSKQEREVEFSDHFKLLEEHIRYLAECVTCVVRNVKLDPDSGELEDGRDMKVSKIEENLKEIYMRNKS